MAETAQTETPTKATITPEAYRFADMHAAREDLMARLRRLGDNELEELRGVARTVQALAECHAEAGDSVILDPESLLYLAKRLMAVSADIALWNDEVWPVAVIVNENDLAALERKPGALQGLQNRAGSAAAS